MVHNTDSDELLLLVIKDFSTLEIIEKDVSGRVKNELSLLVRRLGGGTFSCLANVTTFFMSSEFESLLKRIAFDQDEGRVGQTIPQTMTIELVTKKSVGV